MALWSPPSGMTISNPGDQVDSVQSIAVFDLETTSKFPTSDTRIVEIAIVLLDPATLEVIHEFDSLVNPQRDFTEASMIHHISASMVSAAPAFSDIAGRVAQLLSGSILVAHNLRGFDQRILGFEFERLGAWPNFGKGIDTFSLSKQKLETICGVLGIDLVGAHSALGDARSTAEVLRHFAKVRPEVLTGEAASIELPIRTETFRTLRREQVGQGVARPLRIPPIRFGLPATEDSQLTYLHVLDDFLSDGALTEFESDSLRRLASVLALETEVEGLHRKYFENACAAATEDGDINALERDYLDWIAQSLDIDIASIELPSRRVLDLKNQESGLRICFTGTSAEQEKELYALAAAFGHVPVESVTKKGCDVLVCVDTSTMSGKAKKARDFDIVIVSVEQFQLDLGHS